MSPGMGGMGGGGMGTLQAVISYLRTRPSPRRPVTSTGLSPRVPAVTAPHVWRARVV